MNNVVISMLAKKATPVMRPKINRGNLILKKQSPHIFFGVGIVGSITSTVLACRATLKLPDTLGVIEKETSVIKEFRSAYLQMTPEDQEKYTKQDLAKDTAQVYGKAAYKLGRLYGPAVGVGIISIAALSGSHIALSRRNTALMAAYAAVSKAYDDYRERVIQELGADKERDLYHARINTDDEDTCVVDPNQWSPYARFFDEGSPHWEKNSEFNRLYVQCQQNYANEKLRAQGHLFLNEVYDMLGIDRSQAGAVVGWVIGDKGDNYIDFGMYEAVNSRFINGWERSILLDFNVDGVIYDKI